MTPIAFALLTTGQLSAHQHTTPSGSSAAHNEVSITQEGESRVITANGIPDHATGNFPNRNNPNTISAQQYAYRVPLNPQPAAQPTPLGMHPFGIGVNGVPFDPGAAEWWNNDQRSGWQYEAMSGAVELGIDQNHAHVQPTGAYHYHAMPTGLVKSQSKGQGMVLVGYAADGFPIYAANGFSDANDASSAVRELKSSYRIKDGTRPDGPGGRYDGSYVQDYEFVEGAGDLDAANGRTGVTPEYPDGTYYYVITNDFPYIPRQFTGTPDTSFMRGGPAGGRPDMRGGQANGRPPQGGQQGRPPPPNGGRGAPPPRC